MKKLIFITLLLMILDLFAYHYLNSIIGKIKPLKLDIKENNIIYQKKDLLIHDTGSFELLDYFIVYGKPFKYSIDDNYVNININEEKVQIPYQLVEKEIEETIIYVDRPIYQNAYENNQIEDNNSFHNEINVIETYEKPSISYNGSYSFSVNTDINSIVDTILSSISTSIPISLDYSFLNPNEKGEYIVFLNSEIDSKQIVVNII